MDYGVTLDEFKKLKQNDRIEFLLRRKHIEEKKSSFGWASFFYTMIGIMGFLILLVVGAWNINQEASLKLFGLIPTLTKIAIIGTGIFMIGDFIGEISAMKEHKKLEEEFFKKEIKPRKN